MLHLPDSTDFLAGTTPVCSSLDVNMWARHSHHTHHRSDKYSHWIVESYLTHLSVDAYISLDSSLKFITLCWAQMLPESSIILLYAILEQLICNTCLSSYFQKRNFHQMYWPLNLMLGFVSGVLQNIKQSYESLTDLFFWFWFESSHDAVFYSYVSWKYLFLLD